MKLIERWRGLVAVAWCFTGLVSQAEVHRSEWRQRQTLDISAPGLIKVPLPAETLGVLRPGAVDLRLLDPSGNEVGWYLERPLRFAPESPIQPVKSFRTTLGRRATEIVLETGTPLPIAGLALETGTGSFLKSVRVEGSRDGEVWEPVADRMPVYQSYQGETRRQITFPAQAWKWLRVTVDDTRTTPVLFTGARMQLVTDGTRPGLERRSARLVSREELPGESRLTLDLGSANLEVAALRVTSPEGVFTRTASLRTRGLEKNAWADRIVARGLLYRELATDGTATTAPVRWEIGESVPSREAVLVIHNGDNPPLNIVAVELEIAPPQLVFWARQAGPFEVLAENPICGAPQYDLGAFAEQIKTAIPRSAVFGPLAPNPAYQPPAVVPLPFALGAALDVSGWRFRKALPVARDGAQQVELDAAVLAGARSDFGDLRLVSEGRQRPFVVESLPGLRSLTLEVTSTDDPKRPSLSRWKLKLPRSGLPIVSLEIDTSSGLFDREVTLWEEVADERGEIARRNLGEGRWRRTPGESAQPLRLGIRERPVKDVLWMEIRNGDNAPISVSAVRAFYPGTRLHFLAPVAPATWLYYGNPKVTAPDYDLQLVAARLLAADTVALMAGPEEASGNGVWSERVFSRGGRGVFWVALGAVVVVLLGVMRRLLPPPASPS